jgi:hypothetical protein
MFLRGSGLIALDLRPARAGLGVLHGVQFCRACLQLAPASCLSTPQFRAGTGHKLERKLFRRIKTEKSPLERCIVLACLNAVIPQTLLEIGMPTVSDLGICSNIDGGVLLVYNTRSVHQGEIVECEAVRLL